MQMRFVEEYLKDSSSMTKAAFRAGYKEKWATKIGSALFSDPRIRKLINKGQEDSIRRTGITRDRVLQELGLLAFANIREIVTQDEEGNTDVNLGRLSSDRAAALQEISIVTTTVGKKKVRTVKVKLADKNTALEKLGKHLGLFVDKIEVTGKLSLEQLVNAALRLEAPSQPTQISQPQSPQIIEADYTVVPKESNPD